MTREAEFWSGKNSVVKKDGFLLRQEKGLAKNFPNFSLYLRHIKLEKKNIPKLGN